MSNKKAQGVSMNFLVIMAIALIVMLIIIGIFVGKSKEGANNLSDCEGRGGECKSGECSTYGLISLPSGKCYTNNQLDKNKKCCLRNDLSFGETDSSTNS